MHDVVAARTYEAPPLPLPLNKLWPPVWTDELNYDDVINSDTELPVPRIESAAFNMGGSASMAADGTTTVAQCPPQFVLDSSGRRPDPDKQINVRLAIRAVGISFAYNEFTGRIHVCRGKQEELISDAIEIRLWLLIEAKFGFRSSRELFRAVISDEAHSASFHPVRQYLDGLLWDGVARIDEWLIKHAGAPDSAYTRAVSRLLLVGAVRRIRRPGCKFDEMVVLIGLQGVGKSSLLLALVPRPEWYSDCLPLNASTKEVIEQTESKWIIEAADLAGMSNSQVEKLKAMLSRQVDSARLAYGHHREDRPRQFIIVGTTNDSEFLRDMTGNRRFWPVEVQRCDVKTLAAIRDQLWAEAAAREAAGESTRLPESLWPEAQRQQDQRTVGDPWEDELRHCLPTTGKQTRKEIFGLLKDPGKWTRADSVRLGQVMERLGWKKTTIWVKGKAEAGYTKD